MKDLIVIVMTVGFFALAVGYVALCNRIIGPDTFEGDTTDTGDAELGDADIGGDAGDRPGPVEVTA
jgi:hypothetical protein